MNTEFETPTIWFVKSPMPTAAQINTASSNTLVAHLGIEIIEVGADFLRATMPVDARTHQPMGLLHGGASVVLAETLGSSAGFMCVDSSKFNIVGTEINANHLRSVRSGFVTGTTRPLHLGRSSQVWEICIENDKQQLVCISRLTVAVVPKA
jgi:1,4-dihydroxy-2-naphthoyl-CoA hydrolase